MNVHRLLAHRPLPLFLPDSVIVQSNIFNPKMLQAHMGVLVLIFLINYGVWWMLEINF